MKEWYMMDETKLNGNFIRYIQRMERYKCYSQQMIDELGDKIKRAPYSLSADGGGAYEGGLIDVVMYRLCKLAYDINMMAFGGASQSEEKVSHPQLMVNNDMLMRVLLLQHISKAEMFTVQTDDWKKKKGRLYDFDETLKSNLKLGERSLYICQKYGIVLTDEEFEAIRIIDREWDDKHIIMSSPLSAIVRVVNILTTIELKKNYTSQYENR